MPAYFNVADFVKIGIMAILFLYLANMGLKKAGLNDFAV